MKHQRNTRLRVWIHWILAGIGVGLVGAGMIVSPLSAEAADPIKVAAIVSKTGIGVQATLKFRSGLQLAVEEINQQGGVLGRPIEVIEFDSKSSPIGAKEAALQAIEQQVVAALGMTPSSLALVIAPLLQEAGIPAITHQATHPDITKIGDYIFRVCYIDTYQGKVLAQFALHDLKARTAVMLVNTTEIYSMGLAKVFEDAFTQQGGNVLWQGLYRQETLDFQEFLQKVNDMHADVTFVPGHIRDDALIAKQAANLGLRIAFLGGDTWGELPNYQADVVNAAEGTYFSTHWHSQVSSPMSDHFEQAFRQKYGEEITSGAALMYDAVMLLADAIERAQTTEPQALRDTLAATQNFQGVTGALTFDADRNPLNKEAVILTYRDGKIEFVKSVKP